MATELMIDLETLGTDNDAAVIAIGAVKWNRQTLEVGDTFYSTIRVTDAEKYGTKTQSTMDWWMKQDDNARAHAFTGVQSSMDIARNFAQFAAGCRPWGNGSVFDVIISDSLFHAHGIKSPWKFWDISDLRTLVLLAEDLTDFRKKDIPFVGLPHHALHDALHETNLAVAAIKALRGMRGEIPQSLTIITE